MYINIPTSVTTVFNFVHIYCPVSTYIQNYESFNHNDMSSCLQVQQSLMMCCSQGSYPHPQMFLNIFFNFLYESWLQLLLIDKKLGDVHTILLSARVQVEQLVSSNPTQKESLRVFFLILQVCHYLMAGQVRVECLHHHFFNVFKITMYSTLLYSLTHVLAYKYFKRSKWILILSRLMALYKYGLIIVSSSTLYFACHFHQSNAAANT